jgi:hypothetical protein
MPQATLEVLRGSMADAVLKSAGCGELGLSIYQLYYILLDRSKTSESRQCEGRTPKRS